MPNRLLASESAKSAPPAVYMYSGGLSNAPRLLMPHLSDIRPFLRRKRSFPGPGMCLACLNYSRQDTHTKVHIARSTVTNRGEGALHLGAEVSMHCAISMWIPPLHRTMAHVRRARKRPRRRPPGAPCNPRGAAGWVRVRFYGNAGASKRPKRAQHQKLLCMFKMSIRRPQNRTQRGQKPPQPPPTTLGPPESPPRDLGSPMIAYMQSLSVRDSTYVV